MGNHFSFSVLVCSALLFSLACVEEEAQCDINGETLSLLECSVDETDFAELRLEPSCNNSDGLSLVFNFASESGGSCGEEFITDGVVLTVGYPDVGTALVETDFKNDDDGATVRLVDTDSRPIKAAMQYTFDGDQAKGIWRAVIDGEVVGGEFDIEVCPESPRSKCG